MATQAWPALGTILSYTISGSSAVPVGELLSVSNAGGGEVGERDTSNLGSTAKTNMPTIPDNGEVTFSLNWDPTDAGHIQIRTWKDTPPATLPTWTVTFPVTPTAKTASFEGWVKGLDGPNAEGIDENLVADVTVRVSGAVTWT